MYHGHARVHHRIYRWDSTYEVGSRKPEHVTFTWAYSVGVIALHLPVAYALYLSVGLASSIGLLFSGLAYYSAYEMLHYRFHVPKGRWIERTGLVKWLNSHHRQHHRQYDTNLNIFIPLADYVFRTRGQGVRHHGLIDSPHDRAARPSEVTAGVGMPSDQVALDQAQGF